MAPPPVNYPMNRSNSNGTRRVEFSGLPTIDSEAPEEPNTTSPWDTETGMYDLNLTTS